jgi:hypothetical protein
MDILIIMEDGMDKESLKAMWDERADEWIEVGTRGGRESLETGKLYWMATRGDFKSNSLLIKESPKLFIGLKGLSDGSTAVVAEFSAGDGMILWGTRFYDYALEVK